MLGTSAALPTRATLGAAAAGYPVGPFDLAASTAVSVRRGGRVSPAGGVELGYMPIDGVIVRRPRRRAATGEERRGAGHARRDRSRSIGSRSTTGSSRIRGRAAAIASASESGSRSDQRYVEPHCRSRPDASHGSARNDFCLPDTPDRSPRIRCHRRRPARLAFDRTRVASSSLVRHRSRS